MKPVHGKWANELNHHLRKVDGQLSVVDENNASRQDLLHVAKMFLSLCIMTHSYFGDMSAVWY